MALKYLPKLPEGLHPFYCIFAMELEYNRGTKLILVSADAPLKFSSDGNIGTLYGSVATNQRYNVETEKWEDGEWYQGGAIIRDNCYYNGGNFIYTNFDVINRNGGSIYQKKSVDASKITIDGGDIRNMQKGMIWNVGAAVSIEPKEAPQLCTFSSSNPDVCTVDETGKIVAVGEGECIITITSKM